MSSEEAVTIAERYLDTGSVSHGSLRFTRFSTGAEFDPTCRPPPHWVVYFWYDAPVEDPPDDMAETCLCVTVDDASGAARLVCWL